MISLTEYMPTLAEEWDYDNNSSTPEKMAAFSSEYVWWKCERGHQWQTQVRSRSIRKSKCPYCAGRKPIKGMTDLKTINPTLAKEWDMKKNKELSPENVLPGTNRKVWWKCKKGHSFMMEISKRNSRGDGCPYCSGRYPVLGVNDLGTLHPEAKKFWNEQVNGSIQNYTSSSGRKVGWVCEKNHTWVRMISMQVMSNYCPYCNGKQLIKGENDLKTLFPKLAREFDEEKNKEKSINVKPSAHSKYYWKCSKGHSWKTELQNRLQGKGCPYCAGKYPIKGENDLATLYPWLLDEWNYELNLKSPDEYLPKSNKKVWWQCEKGHIWKALISERTRGTGCPECIKEK